MFPFPSPQSPVAKMQRSFVGKAVEARARPSGKTQALWRKWREGAVGQRPWNLVHAHIHYSLGSQFDTHSLANSFRALHYDSMSSI